MNYDFKNGPHKDESSQQPFHDAVKDGSKERERKRRYERERERERRVKRKAYSSTIRQL